MMATCLVESAENDFHRSGLLMANHMDSLCELVQYAELGEILLNDNEGFSQVVLRNERRTSRVIADFKGV